MEERGRVEGELAVALEGMGEGGLVVDAMVAPWRRVMCVFSSIFLMSRVLEEWLTGVEISRG